MTISKANAVKRIKEVKLSLTGKEIIIQGVYFLCGALVSRGAVFGTLSPFGGAYVSAVPFHNMLSSIAGCVVGYMMLNPGSAFRYIAILVAIGTLRWVLGDIKAISKHILFTPLVAFLPVFATGIALLFTDSSDIGSILTCFIEATIAGASAYFIKETVRISSVKRSISSFSQQEISCIVMAGCIMLLALSAISIRGISLGRILAIIVVLFCGRYGGVTGGSISGIATGIIFSLSGNNYTFISGGYGFGGMMAGLFGSMGKLGSVLSFFICSTMMSFSCDEPTIVFACAIETVVASTVFMLLPSSFGNVVSSIFLPVDDINNGNALKKNVIMRLEYAAKALSGVSSCVSSVSEKLHKVYSPDFSAVYQKTSKEVCGGCGLKMFCWDREKATTIDDFNNLTETLKLNKGITEKDVEELFVKKCCKAPALAQKTTEHYQEYLMSNIAQRRVSQVRSAVAGQFVGLSDILSDMGKEFSATEVCDIDSAERISEMLRRKGQLPILVSCRIDVVNRMTVEIEISQSNKEGLQKGMLRREVEKCCGRHFDMPVISKAKDRYRIVLSELAIYDTEIASSQHTANNGKLCGDSLNYFTDGMGNMVCMISDGMGTGGRAAVDGNMTTSIMTKLLKAGLSPSCALNVVNSSLMVKSEEESLSTLDISVINRYTGKIDFLKAGAPVTYVKKNSKIFRKDMPSLPLGILAQVKFSKDSINLTGEDMIVMISDGAFYGDDKWLQSLILRWNESSCQELADMVVEEALRRRETQYDDDITALVIRIKDNS